MKHTVEIDFKESVKVEVESYRGWDKERPHRSIINFSIGNLEINGLVEEDAEFLYQSFDRELHDETDEKREIRYQKVIQENEILKDENMELKNRVDYLENRKGIV